jgi:hypothetical protein
MPVNTDLPSPLSIVPGTSLVTYIRGEEDVLTVSVVVQYGRVWYHHDAHDVVHTRLPMISTECNAGGM